MATNLSLSWTPAARTRGSNRNHGCAGSYVGRTDEVMLRPTWRRMSPQAKPSTQGSDVAPEGRSCSCTRAHLPFAANIRCSVAAICSSTRCLHDGDSPRAAIASSIHEAEWYMRGLRPPPTSGRRLLVCYSRRAWKCPRRRCLAPTRKRLRRRCLGPTRAPAADGLTYCSRRRGHGQYSPQNDRTGAQRICGGGLAAAPAPAAATDAPPAPAAAADAFTRACACACACGCACGGGGGGNDKSGLSTACMMAAPVSMEPSSRLYRNAYWGMEYILDLASLHLLSREAAAEGQHAI